MLYRINNSNIKNSNARNVDIYRDVDKIYQVKEEKIWVFNVDDWYLATLTSLSFVFSSFKSFLHLNFIIGWYS